MLQCVILTVLGHFLSSSKLSNITACRYTLRLNFFSEIQTRSFPPNGGRPHKIVLTLTLYCPRVTYLSNARQFYSSKGDHLGSKGLKLLYLEKKPQQPWLVFMLVELEFRVLCRKASEA